jgi:hypothetical protein
MPEPYKFPWGLKPLDPMVEKEFQRRVKDYNLNPTSSPSDSAPYSGPRTAWIRVFSNGISKDDEENGTPNGFVLGGTEGFDESYGFAPSAYDMEATDGKVTIGVDCWGDKHEISATPTDPSLGVGSDTPHRPPPSVVSLETEFSGGNNSGFNATCRKTKISWKCYSLSQLEYLTPYFLTPRITILAEWGWNNYDPSSLVDLTSTETLYKIFKGDKEEIDNRIRRSHGNYDLALGFITDYGYTMNDFGGFDGYTTITNANYLVEGKSYQNRQDSKQDNTNPSASLKLKDFKEFVFEDMDNLTIKNTNAKTVRVENPRYSGPYGGHIYGGNYSPTYTEERDASTDIKINTKYKVFKNDDDQWMRMDLVAEIINQFFSIKFLDSNNKEVDVAAGVLDIREVPICAHPAIKSTNRNFIIPNKFAPRFVSKSDSTKDDSLVDKEARRLSDIKQVGSISTTQNPSPNGEYAKLFPDILKVIEENKLDDTFDNLVSALNTGGARTKYGSFPQFKDYEDNVNNKGYPKAGYWGYLEDVFVSVKYFKGLVEKHETVLRLIEELLQGISECMCNIAQLQLKPDTVGNVRKFVIDNNFTPIGDDRSAEKLPRFVLNATNNAFMKSNSITIKISTDMMNQMVMQSANQKQIPSEYGTATYDPKSMKYSVFQRGDRMFNCGVFTPKQIQDSNSSTDNGKGKFTRMFTEQNPDLYVYIYNPTKKGQNFLERTVGTGTDSDEANQVYILTETNSNFLKTILLDMKNASKAVYTNNGIMPGTDFKMEFLGLSGITFLSQFTLDHVPRTYSYKNAVWQISDVRHRVENKIWTTSITAQARPFITINEKV